MTRILFANFAECPENLHFETAFIRALGKKKGVLLDIIHDFRFPYSFIEKLPLPDGGRRIRRSSLACAKKELRGPRDLLVLLDFPKRRSCAAIFLWLLTDPGFRRKIFIANHLLPMPGHNPTADITRKLGLLRALDQAFILEFDDRDLWERTGLEKGRIFKRPYGVDCRYYSPGRADAAGDYIFSAGSAGRNFKALSRAAGGTGLPLKIFSDAGPAPADSGTEVLPFAKNLHNLKSAMLGARAVALPITDAHLNEAAGNSIAFIAMALGRPIITKRTRYMERFVEDGKTGFLYDKLTAPALSKQLGRALSLRPFELKKLGRAARARILQKASLDAFVGRFAGEFLFRKS